MFGIHGDGADCCSPLSHSDMIWHQQDHMRNPSRSVSRSSLPSFNVQTIICRLYARAGVVGLHQVLAVNHYRVGLRCRAQQSSSGPSRSAVTATEIGVTTPARGRATWWPGSIAVRVHCLSFRSCTRSYSTYCNFSADVGSGRRTRWSSTVPYAALPVYSRLWARGKGGR